MGAKPTKEEIDARVLLKERDDAISRQRYYELFELRQDWNFVFGEDAPKQKKEVLTIKDMTPREVWMEDMYLFKQIVAHRPNELFHGQSEYALKWTPPGSNFKLMVPFDNPAMQEAVMIQLSRIPLPVRKLILFHFAPRDPNQTMFREAVHPASLLSYHHKNEVLQKLCAQFLEDRMDIVEFNETIGSTYDVWKRAMFNMLPEDEQVYHTYLTDMPEAEPSVKLLDNEYLEGRITLQEYEDLKFPDRKKRREADALKYPLPHISGLCIICNNPERGIIKCNVCDNKVCIDCIWKKFHEAKTKEGSYLLIHRRFCLKLPLLKPIHVEVQMPPAYLRELRMTGLAAALQLLAEETKPEIEEEEEEEEDVEDEEERRYREEMKRIKEEREFKAMMKENPPALQQCIKIWERKIEKKFLHIRKEALEQQVRIDEPGHSDFFVERLVRLKLECVEKLPEVVILPATPLLEKAIELDLQESVTCKAFIDKLKLILKESQAMLKMTSMQEFEDFVNGITVEERQVMIAEEQLKAAQMKAERETAEAEVAALALAQANEDLEAKLAEEDAERKQIKAAAGDDDDSDVDHFGEQESSKATVNEEDLQLAVADSKNSSSTKNSVQVKRQGLEIDEKISVNITEGDSKNNNSLPDDKEKSKDKGKEKKEEHKHKSKRHDHEEKNSGTGAGGAEEADNHWERPDAKTRMERKKGIHKHPDHKSAEARAKVEHASKMD